MSVIDTHCDALLKLWEDRKLSFTDSISIDCNAERLVKGQVKVQCFAIFVEPFVKQDQKFSVVLEQIDLFYQKVLTPHPQFKLIRHWHEIETLEDGEIGAILTLEGVDPIGDDLARLRILYELGVRSVGLTWNQANLCADGVGETRGAGLSNLGKELVKENNRYNVLTDVSHLSEAGFWDVIKLADYPIASHSNAKAKCVHPRNLTDEQIKALIDAKGFIGVVFYPLFLNGTNHATISDILHHIDHICSLGGEKFIGFGSDFDGIDKKVENLKNAEMYPVLLNELLKHYSEETVRGFANENFIRMLSKNV
nr:dipeptidase [Halalkalibacterium ligniniphilum]